MGISRTNIPDDYLCEICQPRRVDRAHARALQMRKREELLNSDTSSDSSFSVSTDTDITPRTLLKNSKHRKFNLSSSKRKNNVTCRPRRYNNNRKNSSKNNIKCNNNNKHNKINKNNDNCNNDSSNSDNNFNNVNKSKNINKKQKKGLNSVQTSVPCNKKEIPAESATMILTANSSSLTTTIISSTTCTTSQEIKHQEDIKRKSKKLIIHKSGKTADTLDLSSNKGTIKQLFNKYEEAVTNHYSPELRAKILNVKDNGTVNEFRQCILSSGVNQKYHLNIQQNNDKVNMFIIIFNFKFKKKVLKYNKKKKKF